MRRSPCRRGANPTPPASTSTGSAPCRIWNLPCRPTSRTRPPFPLPRRSPEALTPCPHGGERAKQVAPLLCCLLWEDGEEVVAGDFLSRLGFERIEQGVVALHRRCIGRKVAHDVRADHEAIRERLDDRDPVVGDLIVFVEVGIEDDPGEIYREVVVSLQHPADLRGERGDVDTAADPRMTPDEAGLRVLLDSLLH